MNYYFENGELVVQYEEDDQRYDPSTGQFHPVMHTRLARLPLAFAASLRNWLNQELDPYLKRQESQRERERQVRIATLKEELARLEAGN